MRLCGRTPNSHITFRHEKRLLWVMLLFASLKINSDKLRSSQQVSNKWNKINLFHKLILCFKISCWQVENVIIYRFSVYLMILFSIFYAVSKHYLFIKLLISRRGPIWKILPKNKNIFTLKFNSTDQCTEDFIPIFPIVCNEL